jgi:hypothetical protein
MKTYAARFALMTMAMALQLALAIAMIMMPVAFPVIPKSATDVTLTKIAIPQRLATGMLTAMVNRIRAARTGNSQLPFAETDVFNKRKSRSHRPRLLQCCGECVQ